jgi:uncharacterized protein (TIGR03435 family)
MQAYTPTRQAGSWRALSLFLICVLTLMAQGAAAQAFDVASIRPSSGAVEFEHNGKTTFDRGSLRMHDVTIETCIELAYHTTSSQILDPSGTLRDVHYDILAKTAPETSKEEMQGMLRALLAERFGLKVHTEQRELKVYTLLVAKGGIKMHPAAAGGERMRENNATGVVARSISMQELAEYLSDPLSAALVDGTGLPGRYDLAIDFTPYVDIGPRDESTVRPDVVAVMKAALKGELGLEIVQEKKMMAVMVVDHIEPASAN